MTHLNAREIMSEMEPHLRKLGFTLRFGKYEHLCYLNSLSGMAWAVFRMDWNGRGVITPPHITYERVDGGHQNTLFASNIWNSDDEPDHKSTFSLGRVIDNPKGLARYIVTAVKKHAKVLVTLESAARAYTESALRLNNQIARWQARQLVQYVGRTDHEARVQFHCGLEIRMCTQWERMTVEDDGPLIFKARGPRVVECKMSYSNMELSAVEKILEALTGETVA